MIRGTAKFHRGVRILDRELHGSFTAKKRACSGKGPGLTYLGKPRKRGEYFRIQESDSSLIPRHHPNHIAEANRLRFIRKVVNEMRSIGGGYWPAIKTDTYKPRKTS